ncbi:MAG: pyruvate dehydrogenase (acetyl-transferring) E1 component subunit alpha [Alphaproteobacteria bacterium]|nr:pyruvate dehydrogenase (acetyl-transferring) E1 component subunit alpha [Alphaproteobacteria bacterium]
MRHASAGGEVVATFEIRRRAFLDRRGRLAEPAPPVAHDRGAMREMYRVMALARSFDAKAIALQRTGRLFTYPSCQGQEAVGVGIASAMSDCDVLLPTYREQSAQIWRGVKLYELFLYWAGDERGSDFGGPRKDFPVSVPIGTHAPHAVGVATAIKLRKEPRVAVCVLGDGGSSKGDFYEALNFAGVWRLPVVFVVCNNEWAISMPRASQTAADTLAQKAIAAGLPGEQVDGNDVIAVHCAAEEAIGRARDGGGASVIEALTYRMGDHTTADDARRYRDETEVSARWAYDPLARVRTYMAVRGWWTKDDETALIVACRDEVEAELKVFEATPPRPPTAMFDYVYATLPPSLARQKAMMAGRHDAR